MSLDSAARAWSVLDQTARARFDILAEQQPGLLPRLLAPFARRDIAPDSVHADRSGSDGMWVRIALDAVPAEQVAGIEGNLRQVVGVRTVLVQREVTGQVRRAG